MSGEKRMPARLVPSEMAVSKFRSRMAETLDDARAGHVSYITRNGRPIAAVVPVEAAQAYEQAGSTRAVLIAAFSNAVNTATNDIVDTLRNLQEQYSVESVAACPQQDECVLLANPTAEA